MKPRCPMAVASGLLLAACLTPYEARHEGQWDARDQIWLTEASQLELRSAQSRLFDLTDRVRILTAVVATLQDLDFMIEVLDEELGIVSGSKFVSTEGQPWPDAAYHLYDDQTLLLFSRTYLSWGPFVHRNDLVRVTVTVRQRNEAQSVVRASVQYYLAAVRDPEIYQRFFRAVEQALFLQAHLLEAETGRSG